MPEAARQKILDAVVSSVPKSFLTEMNDRARKAYSEVFHQVNSDKTILREHRLAKLKADRQFRMEWEFEKAARNAGLPVTPRPIEENTWCYVYAKAGGIGFTQSYVKHHKGIPQEATFRQQLASKSVLPRLDLLDDDPELFQPCEFYALFAHTPMADEFTEQKQMLGSMQLCVPDSAMKGWVLQKSLIEIVAMYPTETKRAVVGREPTMKPLTDRKRGEQ